MDRMNRVLCMYGESDNMIGVMALHQCQAIVGKATAEVGTDDMHISRGEIDGLAANLSPSTKN